MKAVIPAAGVGTRLRPHTLNKPKALLPVAGKPILAHIIDDLTAAGIAECVVIIGYHGDSVRRWFGEQRPDVKMRFVEQERRLGLGHAVWTARDALGDEPFFCILGDTILKADYAALLQAPTSIVAVREVEDPRRFGVAETRDGRVTRFVEKPDRPTSNLALVGAYLFRDAPALWRGMERVIREDIRTKNEYQLTDGLQQMVAEGVELRTVPVTDWYDCGKRETWLETNRVLLDREAPGPASGGEGVRITPPCFVGAGAELRDTRIGPHVSVGPGARLVGCDLADCIVGERSTLTGCRLRASLVGEQCRVTDVTGEINIGDFCELQGAGS
ncbi:MAG: sugar phosphate nucleotidyltransferase [Candidatus Krumholzibacteriia bacterium]